MEHILKKANVRRVPVDYPEDAVVELANAYLELAVKMRASHDTILGAVAMMLGYVRDDR